MLNKELWDNILRFDLDQSQGDYPFSMRLADEQTWTRQFTRDAILEYKKFMYLAATSSGTVSPSEIVDAVWHQHLVFTASYQALCGIAGKQIMHIPSTGNREDAKRFEQARIHTRELYEQTFGRQPDAIWSDANPFDSLRVKPGGIGITTVTLIALLFFIALAPFGYRLLLPLYAAIGNPDFVVGYIALGALLYGLMFFFNTNGINNMLNKVDPGSFIHDLHPLELVYLRKGHIKYTMAWAVQELYEQGTLVLTGERNLALVNHTASASPEQAAVIEALSRIGDLSYRLLTKYLSGRALFHNIGKSMDRLRFHLETAQTFVRIYILNLFICGMFLLAGVIRIMTGISRDKPVLYITLVCVAALAAVIIHLRNLKAAPKDAIVQRYERKFQAPGNKTANDWEWRYFSSGLSILHPTLAVMVNWHYTHPSTNSDGSSSCGGGDGGGGCGGGCGGCGGD